MLIRRVEVPDKKQDCIKCLEIDHPTFDEPIRVALSDEEVATNHGKYYPAMPANPLLDEEEKWFDLPDGTKIEVRSVPRHMARLP
jgi:hypothetical protein